MLDKDKTYYLTIHGHFYQPPRENPWLETIEMQDSANPFHDWNERVSHECYKPNAASRILDFKNEILDIVNNYRYMSFNFGPTLLSWLETHDPKSYDKIIEADRYSIEHFNGHGNAIAQVYNHIIMPLANEQDKYTQVIWGIKDFQYRFGRLPEGMWLAETAADDNTLRVLVDCGIKYTVLSPYQALRAKPLNSDENYWQDVSWGNIDPGQAYRYYLKDGTDRYIDLFFYDGAISRAVAFENLLQNGDKFINRITDGISSSRDYDQLINLATDGESYGHHTKFGEMALAYVLKKRATEVGFTLTNFGEYLEKYPPRWQAEIKEPSSWSCFHGIERWRSDCGCSTGAGPGWNQKWRKPLREALDWLRDELSLIYEKNAQYYLKEPWKTRNKYIDIILDRNDSKIIDFCNHEALRKLTQEETVNVIKLLEIQRQALLMYTSCGWFFADISGIETVQILKYAARAMQLAEEFSDVSLEETFLEKLDEAKSNIIKFGSGKDIYEKFVKPSIVSVKQVVSHWAISSLFEDYEDEIEIYCYTIKTLDYRKIKKGITTLVLGRLEITSKVTLEKNDMIFAMLHFGGEDFHCVIRGFSGNNEFNKIKEDLIEKYSSLSLTEVIRSLDDHFGKEYFTIKDLFLDKKRKVISILIKDQLEKFSSTYKNLYEEGKGPMIQLYELGLPVPPEFKIAAEYTLSYYLNEIINNSEDIIDKDILDDAIRINKEAKKIGAELNRQPIEKIYSNHIAKQIQRFDKSMELPQCEELIEILDISKKLSLELDLTEAQNIYFNSIFAKIPNMINSLSSSENMEIDKRFVMVSLKLGEKLGFNIEKYNQDLNKALIHSN